MRYTEGQGKSVLEQRALADHVIVHSRTAATWQSVISC